MEHTEYNHKHLSWKELMHYGQLGLVKGLSRDVAIRIAEDTKELEKLQDLEVRCEEMRDALDQIRDVAEGALINE